jgi:hypothetical protein
LIPPETPAIRFRSLARSECSVCEGSMLAKPRWFGRYAKARSCILCEELCCALCHCQCQCLNRCDFEQYGDLEVCVSCLAWCHAGWTTI